MDDLSKYIYRAALRNRIIEAHEIKYQYARRKAIVKKIRNERCSKCEWNENYLTIKEQHCLYYDDKVKPYWHMACFKERK